MKTLQEQCSLFLPWEDLTLFNTDKWQSLQGGCNFGVSLVSTEDNIGPPTVVEEFLFSIACSFRTTTKKHWIASYLSFLFLFLFFFNWLIRFHESFQNRKTMKTEVEKFPPLKGKQRNIAYQETFTSDSTQALFSGFRMVGLTSRAAFTLITGLALQRKYPFQQHSAPR